MKKGWSLLTLVAFAGAFAFFVSLDEGAETARERNQISTPTKKDDWANESAIPADPDLSWGKSAEDEILDPKTVFLSLDDVGKASMTLGFGPDFDGHGSISNLFHSLERRFDSQDFSVAGDLARLYRDCQFARADMAARHDPASPGYAVTQACLTLPPRDSGYEADVIATAARAGDPQSILQERGFPPIEVAYTQDEEVRRSWATGIAERLTGLASKGEPRAYFELARLHESGAYGLEDLSSAAVNYRAYLRSLPRHSPEYGRAESALRFACSHTGLTFEAQQQCHGFQNGDQS